MLSGRVERSAHGGDRVELVGTVYRCRLRGLSRMRCGIVLACVANVAHRGSQTPTRPRLRCSCRIGYAPSHDARDWGDPSADH